MPLSPAAYRKPIWSALSDGPKSSCIKRDRLLQMSAAIDDVRLAVIGKETRFCLDEYRGFGHAVRNVYAFNLRPLRLEELTEGLSPCYQRLRAELDDFISFLLAPDRVETYS
ncbi:MAG: hypothetical protein NZ553_07315 [Caldilinea sp.]|nr:hypothetical protein [Caldilinea sp.]MDW8440264.1 hypothetical protein [Caldilineaceae bacterium]